MYLFIQIKDGKPINHPAYPANLVQAFGEISSDWEPFLRVARPEVGLYQKLVSEQPEYQKVNGVWTDVWVIRDMTPEEIQEKQQSVKDAWASMYQAQNWAAWVFNTETCAYEPPIPRPAPVEGKTIFWCGAENNWKETPTYPQDGKQYKFDFFAWAWVEVTA